MRRVLLLLLGLLVSTGTVAAQEVTGLAGWDIFLDPGHSGRENVGVFGYSEAEKNLAVGLELRRLLLETTDIDTVYMSRTNSSQQVSLSQRVDHANSVGAAHFHSIHSNAAGPDVNRVLMLWPQYRDGSEAVPNGGKRMSEIMVALLERSMRIGSSGARGECDFYGVSECRTEQQAPKGSRNFVQGFTVMPSELSEAGFHTNPRQNQLNMNADWKRLEARTFYWSILDYHGIGRPPAHIATGIVTDIETGVPVNGAVVMVDGDSYTTDTYESLFDQYSNDPDELHNGFYYLDSLAAGGPQALTVTAEGFEPFASQVTVVDTFFTFADVALISNVPPGVASSSPEPDEDLFRINQNIVIDFTRQMDPATVEAAFSSDPGLGDDFRWSLQNTRLTIVPDTLLPQTDYSITIGEGAAGRFGHAFDGDGDGQAGGAFVLAFTTGFPDAEAPRLVASTPRPNAGDVELRPVLSLVYDEPVDPASLAGRVRLEAFTGPDVPGQVAHYLVGEQSVVSFFPDEDLAPNAGYRLVVDPGVRDLVGNPETALKQLPFRTGETAFRTTEIDDFEDDVAANWWVPQQSGTTTGIVTDSTHFVVDTEVVNLLTGSTQSFRLDYGWDTDASDWLIREFLSGGPPRSVTFDASYRVQAYVFGDGSGNQFRFAVDDRVPDEAASNHEVSPWFTVDWLGWKLVEWDITADGTGTWLGDGTPDGTLRIDSIQLTHTPGAPAFGSFYFDDLRIAMAETRTAAETADVPGDLELLAAYPNPFRETATIRYALPQAAHVRLAVYDLLGREVAVLVDDRQPAGPHEADFEAGALPSGTYLYRLEAGGRTATGTMQRIK